MTPPEITFADVDLPPRRRAELRAALRRIADHGEGGWPAPVDEIEVTRLLGGGRSGAVVARLAVRRGAHQVIHVAKLDAPEELRREWQAFHESVKPAANALCAPIVAASPEAVRGGTGPAVVVYDHVGQYAGRPAAELRTLEEVVRATLAGQSTVDDTVRLLDRLFDGVGHVLHNRCHVVRSAKSARSRNTGLGPNLTVRVHGTRIDRTSPAPTPHDEVLRTTLRGEPDDLRRGDPIVLTGLRRRHPDDPSVLLGDDIAVRVDPSSTVDIPDEDITLHGTVVETRGDQRRERLAGATDGLVIADPFAALPLVLTEPVRGRAFAFSHGDLNPRNVIEADWQPFLIDYARTAPDRPQQEDYCWLETGLVRDVLADLDRHDLLDLQRVLALTSCAVDGGVAPDAAEAASLVLLGDRLHGPFRLLWAIRRQAHRHYPPDAGQPWWQAYAHELLIAAHRTLKWGPELQTPAKLTATAIVAGVLSEWIAEPDPFRHWRPGLAVAATHAAPVLMPPRSDAMVVLCTRLTAAAGDHDVEDLIADYRRRLVVERCADTAARTVGETTGEHLRYLDLEPVQSRLVEHDAVNLVGEPGIGKSTAARELVHRAAVAVCGGTPRCRMPLLLDHVPDDLIGEVARLGFGGVAEQALALGAVHLVLDPPDQVAARDWAARTRHTYPRTPIVRCTRRADTGPAGFEVVRMHGMDPSGMWTFLHDRLGALGHHSFRIDHLLATVLDDPAWRRAGPHRPGVLATLVEHVRATGDLDHLPHPWKPVGLPHHDAARAYCERLAGHLLTGTPILDEPDESLIATGVLRRVGHRVEFLDPAHQDYFTAQALLRTPDRIPACLARRRCAEAGLILVTLPEVDTATAADIARRVAEFDTVLAGRLLTAARCDRREFTAELRDCLLDPAAGPHAWAEAAEALAAAEASAALGDVAACSSAPEQARIAALSRLDALHRKPHPRAAHRELTRQLAAAVHTALTDDGVTDLWATALDIVARARLHGFELLLGALVHPREPWTLAGRAYRALRALGTALPDDVRDRHVTAARDRLAALDRLLPGTDDVATALALAEERAELAPTATEDWLWLRRFDPDLHHTIAALVADRTTTDNADTLVTAAEDPDPARANRAAHHLLRHHPHQAAELLHRTKADDPPHRLLAAASIARELDLPEDAARLARDLLPDVTDGKPLAALVSAVFATDSPAGVRLAWTCAADLADRDVPGRLRWPWTTTLTTTRSSRDDLELLLCQGEHVPAIEALASFAFHRDAGAGPGWTLHPEAREALLAHRPTTTTDTVQWIRATATADLRAALPTIIDLLPALTGTVVDRGGERQPAATDIPAVLGFLARQADEGTIHDLLSRPWPEAERGRLIGLSYLGDWQPLLEAADHDHTLLPAARNALDLWATDPDDAYQWLAGHPALRRALRHRHVRH
ncbi:hypothetical protein ACQPZF_27755 [Actinosynnema sp. CS-041913]|uniref:hypothetical protein n=1 Tax=Actinosynnema sp. CS-041913 TaxID=3239917 RepID=UPI003D8A6546